MESDGRELRLRSHFGFMMVWTGLTVVVFGYLLGVFLEAACTAAGYFLGFGLGGSTEAAIRVSGHVLVGVAVVAALVQSYLAPDGLPDMDPEDE